MGHSGELETSIMMHISSVYVDNDKAMFKYQFYKGNKWHCPDMFAKNTIIQYRNFNFYSEYRNVGIPKCATVEKDKQIVEVLIKKMAEFCDIFF